jgi:hypothetical protein
MPHLEADRKLRVSSPVLQRSHLFHSLEPVWRISGEGPPAPLERGRNRPRELAAEEQEVVHDFVGNVRKEVVGCGVTEGDALLDAVFLRLFDDLLMPQTGDGHLCGDGIPVPVALSTDVGVSGRRHGTAVNPSLLLSHGVCRWRRSSGAGAAAVERCRCGRWYGSTSRSCLQAGRGAMPPSGQV